MSIHLFGVDTYTSMEVDTFGHFFMKARTSPCWNSAEPKWNEVCPQYFISQYSVTYVAH